MRKILLTITMIFASFFIITPVNAAETNELIYDIESFNIDDANGQIVFKGWAFISNFHNYGGKNTTIKIEAYNSSTTLIKEVKYSEEKDLALYNANCIRHPRKSYDKPGNCIESYSNATCNGSSGSSCRFDNVAFTSTFTLQELVDEFQDTTKTISFRLIVTTNEITKKTDIAVSNLAYKGVTDRYINLSKQNMKIRVSGISDKAKIIVTKGRILENTAGYLKYGEKNYWNKDSSYSILDIKNSTMKDMGQVKMYQLKFWLDPYKVDRQYIRGGENFSCYNGDWVSDYSGNAFATQQYNYWGYRYCSMVTLPTSGWAYASWVRVTGKIEIKLYGEPTPVETCPTEEDTIPTETLECENGSYYQIKNEEINLEDTFYSSDTEFTTYNIEDDECSTKTPRIERDITATACITQSGVATFDITGDNVYSGGGFNFKSNYSGTASYNFCKEDQNTKYEVTMTITDYYCCDECGGGSCISCGVSGEEGYDPCCDTTPTYDTLESIKKEYKITKEKYLTEWNLVTEYMQGLLEEPDDRAKTTSIDSNTVGDTSIVDAWTANTEKTTDSNGDAKHWEPGEVISYGLDFTLYRACIDRETAKVNYIESSDSCDNDEIDGGQLYYIPLKQPTGTVPIKVSVNDVNVLKDEDWEIDYTCKVDNTQKLYNETDWSFNFIYRPITLSTPFPGREPSGNWIPFMEEAKNKNSDAAKKLTRNNLEYEINLSRSDIIKIKNYNKNKKYTSLSTINPNGNSTYLDTLTFKTHTSIYNYLGECTNNCWTSTNSSDVDGDDN